MFVLHCIVGLRRVAVDPMRVECLDSPRVLSKLDEAMAASGVCLCLRPLLRIYPAGPIFVPVLGLTTITFLCNDSLAPKGADLTLPPSLDSSFDDCRHILVGLPRGGLGVEDASRYNIQEKKWDDVIFIASVDGVEA